MKERVPLCQTDDMPILFRAIDANDDDDISSFNNELHYLNKEDRLLRWLLVKHRDIKFGLDFLNFNDDDARADWRKFGSTLSDDEDSESSEDDDYEYNLVDQEDTKET